MKFSALRRDVKYNVLYDDYATQTLELNHPTELKYPGGRAMITIKGEWIRN